MNFLKYIKNIFCKNNTQIDNTQSNNNQSDNTQNIDNISYPFQLGPRRYQSTSLEHNLPTPLNNPKSIPDDEDDDIFI